MVVAPERETMAVRVIRNELRMKKLELRIVSPGDGLDDGPRRYWHDGANNLCWAKSGWVRCAPNILSWVSTIWENHHQVTPKTGLVKICRKITSVEKFDFEFKLNDEIASA